MIIKSRNILSDLSPKTFLSNGIPAATTVYPVKNTTEFTTSWAAQIGETGEEQTEIIIGTVTNIGTITGAASSFPHPADTPIYFIKYDQLVFERSITGTAGVAAPMTSGTVGIQADGTTTLFDDTSGSASYAYKTFFRNSSMAVNSSESDWITSAGFDFYSLARLRQRVRDKLWNANYIKDDSMINDWINELKDDYTNGVIQLNEDYALGTVDVPFGTAGLGTITTADFKQVKRVWITTDGVNFYQSTKTDSRIISPNMSYVNTHPYHAYQGDTILSILPNGAVGTARLEFYRFGTTMVNDTDTLPQPFRSYTKSFVDYANAQALFKDGKLDAYDRRMQAVNQAKSQFIAESTPRDKSGQTYQEMIEPLGGEY
jgi:hypothetical protein